MKIIGVIPARLASTRLSEKVLRPIHGQPMIQHVWQRCQDAQMLDDVMIACDDVKVQTVAKEFGAHAVMTSPDHSSGTDRIAEAVKDVDVDIVLNIQGDEPLIDPVTIDDLARALVDDSECVMATVIKRFCDQENINDPNVVKAITNAQQHAIYFSRSVIPYDREGHFESYYKHLGLYAYRKDFLLGYGQLPKSLLEQAEKLEQLRAIEAGYKIKTVVTDKNFIGVDTLEDLQKVEEVLKSQ